MTRKRILFVDDEIQILEGLENSLRKQRKIWDMVFVLHGDAALAELDKEPFDVIVSDMRMPGMDGRALLEQVKARHPSVSRIVLSGHAEREAIAGVISVAHQFLSKPCDVDTLQLLIVRACELQGLMSSPALRDLIGKLDKLPSVPRTYFELVAAMERPDVGIADVGVIVQKDPAMCIKVLQLVNSAYFGLASRITSVAKAVTYLGVDLLKGLALTSHVFAAADHKLTGLSPAELEEMQERAIKVAKLARKLVRDPSRAEDAFTAAMVHDVGELVLAGGMPLAYAEARRAARATQRPPHVVEKERLGVNHAEVGAYLLGIWGIPFPIVEAVAYHHAPRPLSEMSQDLVCALHLADAAVAAAASGGGTQPVDLDVEFLQRNGYADEVAKLMGSAAPRPAPRAAMGEG